MFYVDNNNDRRAVMRKTQMNTYEQRRANYIYLLHSQALQGMEQKKRKALAIQLALITVDEMRYHDDSEFLQKVRRCVEKI